MKRKLNILAGDTALWMVYILLSVISLVAVFSTIGYYANARPVITTPMALFFKHLAFVVLSYITIIVLSRIDYRSFAKLSQFFIYVAGAMLIFVLIFHTRWLHLPGGISLQPSEFAKIVLMVYMARNIAVNRNQQDDKQFFWKQMFPLLIVCGLVAPENLSTSLLIFISGYILLFFGNVNRAMWWRGFFIIVGLGIIGFLIIYFLGDRIDLFRTSTWGHRLQAWLNPDPNELSQENMARMAVARGGFSGCGIGSTIHGRLMTQAHNDFIYAIIIEEVGSLGALGIFLLYAFFYFRCIRIANACKGLFGSLCVAGIGSLIFIQAVVNMSVAVGVLPVTGQTLPFISYGGSSYLFMSLGVAVIQSVAIDNKKQRMMAQHQASPETIVDETASMPSNEMLNLENNKI